ncbi:MAG: IS1595 family transposase [bacterium]
MKAKYTIKDFQKHFRNDDDCLEYIFKARFPHLKGYYKVVGRRSYADKDGKQIYPTAGMIFHKSPTSLKSWFFAILLMSQSKNGVSAKELERQLGVTYKCAWRMGHQIRKLMQSGDGMLSGIVEADETFVGGLSKNMHKDKRKAAIKGTGGASKTPIIGVMERGGSVIAKTVTHVRGETVIPNVVNNVKKGSTVMTDELPSYRWLPSFGFKHESVNHGVKEYVRANVHTNSIEGFWSQLKRSINGTFHHVSRKHLQAYVDEFAFRYNRRKSETPMFSHLLSQFASE